MIASLSRHLKYISFAYLPRSCLLWFFTHILYCAILFLGVLFSSIYFVLAISFLLTLLYLSPRDHIMQSFSLLFSSPETIRGSGYETIGLLVSPIPTSPHTAAYVAYIFDYPNVSHHVLFVIKASSLLQLGVCMYVLFWKIFSTSTILQLMRCIQLLDMGKANRFSLTKHYIVRSAH